MKAIVDRALESYGDSMTVSNIKAKDEVLQALLVLRNNAFLARLQTQYASYFLSLAVTEYSVTEYQTRHTATHGAITLVDALEEVVKETESKENK